MSLVRFILANNLPVWINHKYVHSISQGETEDVAVIATDRFEFVVANSPDEAAQFLGEDTSYIEEPE